MGSHNFCETNRECFLFSKKYPLLLLILIQGILKPSLHLYLEEYLGFLLLLKIIKTNMKNNHNYGKYSAMAIFLKKNTFWRCHKEKRSELEMLGKHARFCDAS